jgi:3-methyladenine DNA glycosylase Tag
MLRYNESACSHSYPHKQDALVLSIKSRLANPTNDSDAMSAILKKAGFA